MFTECRLSYEKFITFKKPNKSLHLVKSLVMGFTGIKPMLSSSILQGALIPKKLTSSLLSHTSLNPVPNALVCVYLTVHITKLQLQTTFPKRLYIPHSPCIHRDPGRWKS
jgi:hypothetical protein